MPDVDAAQPQKGDMTTCNVEFADVSKNFGAVQAVADFSLRVQKGQFVTLLGASGSGKTTTLMMLAGFLAADSGTIRINGADVTHVPAHRRDIGLVYQHYALFPHMSVGQNVSFPLEMRRRPRKEIAERVEKALTAVRLEGFEDRRPSQLSGGQQQRVALARALVFAPSILLMDEPLGALDKKLREEMQLEIQRIQKEFKITTIYVTHDQEEAMSMSDVVVLMRGGRIEQVDAPSVIYERPKNAFVANFIGSANVLEGTLTRHQGRRVFRSDSGIKVAVNDERPVAQAEGLSMVIRPERIRLLGREASGGRLAATLEGIVYGGSIVKYLARVSSGERFEVVQTNHGSIPFSVGDRVSLDWKDEDALLVPSEEARD